MAKASGAPVARYIGSKISLITTSNIRYEGTLYTLNHKDSTIAVKDVRSYGTESRKVSRQVDQSNEIYDLIVFRGDELKDLTVLEEVPVEKDSGTTWDSMWSENGGTWRDDNLWKGQMPTGHNNSLHSYEYFTSGPNPDPFFGGGREEDPFARPPLHNHAPNSSMMNGGNGLHNPVLQLPLQPAQQPPYVSPLPFASPPQDTAFRVPTNEYHAAGAIGIPCVDKHLNGTGLSQQNNHRSSEVLSGGDLLLQWKGQQQQQQQRNTEGMPWEQPECARDQMHDAGNGHVKGLQRWEGNNQEPKVHQWWNSGVQCTVPVAGGPAVQRTGGEQVEDLNWDTTWEQQERDMEDRDRRNRAQMNGETRDNDRGWLPQELGKSQDNWECDARNAPWRDSWNDSNSVLTPPKQPSPRAKDRSPKPSPSGSLNLIRPLSQVSTGIAAVQRQFSPSREVTCSTRTTVTATSSPANMKSTSTKMLHGDSMFHTNGHVPKLQTPPVSAGRIGRMAEGGDRKWQSPTAATLSTMQAATATYGRRDEGKIKETERLKGDDGRKEVRRGRKFSSLNDVFNYHHGSEAVLLEQLCQHGAAGWSARQLRALSERSPLVYHVYLDFVNFCCPQNNVMDDESLWERFADATRKTFEQHYQQAETYSRPESPRQPGNSPYVLNLPLNADGTPAHTVTLSSNPGTVHTNADSNSTVASAAAQSPVLGNTVRVTQAALVQLSRNDVHNVSRRNPTLADFASKKDTKRKIKEKPPTVQAREKVKPLPSKKKLGLTTGISALTSRENLHTLRRADGSWNCPRCTLRNEVFLLECAACACPLEHASTLSEFPPLGS
eukprot:GEMP01004201.1.p1 GENE.GEMP01004201.1~~GEMP01004201.1.p1  ORF type:complete len:831 (+),score=189.43 GEMP01004201.1:329-2821(+)